MWLIDIEAARQPDGDGPAAAEATTAPGASSGSSPSAATLTSGNKSLALGALAKFLNTVLQVVLTAAPKVLGAPLRAGDADGFGGASSTSSAHWQSGNITRRGALGAVNACETTTGE